MNVKLEKEFKFPNHFNNYSINYSLSIEDDNLDFIITINFNNKKIPYSLICDNYLKILKYNYDLFKISNTNLLNLLEIKTTDYTQTPSSFQQIQKTIDDIEEQIGNINFCFIDNNWFRKVAINYINDKYRLSGDNITSIENYLFNINNLTPLEIENIKKLNQEMGYKLYTLAFSYDHVNFLNNHQMLTNKDNTEIDFNLVQLTEISYYMEKVYLLNIANQLTNKNQKEEYQQNKILLEKYYKHI